MCPQSSDDIDENYILTEGPLPKSQYTIQLEQITRKLLQGEVFDLRVDDGDVLIFPDSSENKIAEIIEFANLEHIELSNDDLKLYSAYLSRSELIVSSPLLKENEGEYLKKLYENYYKKYKEYPRTLISFPEMQAINLYTDMRYFRNINLFLRRVLTARALTLMEDPHKKLKDIIINAVMCASGLNKIPLVGIKTAYRNIASLKSYPTTEYYNKLITAARKQAVVPMFGFVSTSIVESIYPQLPSVKFKFTKLKGAYIAPISAAPGEKELLIPPCQVQVLGYQIKGDITYFTGSFVSDLASVAQESLIMPPLPESLPVSSSTPVLYKKNILRPLENKMLELREKWILGASEYHAAFVKADKLLSELTELGETYFTQKTINSATFVQQFTAFVAEAKPTLEVHRRWWGKFLVALEGF